MKKFIFLLLFSLLLFINAEEIINLDIKQGIYSYKLTKQIIFKFTAIENGFYLIAFSDLVRVTQADGKLGENVNFIKGNYTTIAYSQHFKKGNYFQIIYPANAEFLDMDYLIKIVKFNTDQNIKIYGGSSDVIDTIFFDDCEKPTYLLFRNPLINLGVRPLHYMTLVHSGNFQISRKKEDFLSESPEKIDDNYFSYDIEIPVESRNDVGLNVYKLQCTNPGVVTIFQYLYQSSSYTSLTSSGAVENILMNDKDFGISLEANTKYYIEILNITGKATIDTKDFYGNTYNNKLDLYYAAKTTEYKHIKFTNTGGFYWFMSVINNSGQDIGTRLDDPNHEYIINENQRMIIQISQYITSKNIKIKSNVPKFYWSLEFSIVPMINYVPNPYSKLKYENDNELYIKNPYNYLNKKESFYYFIILYHFNKGNNISFSYEYTNEEKTINYDDDDDENSEDVDNSDDKKKSFVSSAGFWILIIFIILIVIGIALFFYYKYFYLRKTSNSIERLVNDGELNKI